MRPKLIIPARMTEDLPPRINDPTKVDDGPPREAILRGGGGTQSEQYLAKLADRSFLNLWSYPNVFTDKRASPTGDGKELCDLLVVCGDHIVIFSDKTIAWPDGDVDLAWRRWYRRAVHKSLGQIRGAQRWITQFPERIFVDAACTQRLPIQLPPPERRKVHGIVVALGAGEACRDYFGEGRGSLMVVPGIRGDNHFEGEGVQPFVVGDIDPDGPFVHVLDDATLDIVMGELDTISDFTSYLTKKEALVRSGRLLSAQGEKELVAQFMTKMNAAGEHDFVRPDGSPWAENDHVTYAGGHYAALQVDSRYIAKKQADKISYLWDALIQTFTDHMLAGTSIIPAGQKTELSDHEVGIRHMTLLPRFIRRMHGAGVAEVLEKGKATDRYMRAFLPPPEAPSDTAFFFMTLKVPNIQLKGGYEQYRAVRRNMLEAYGLTLLHRNPQLKRIIGIATEPPSAATNSQGSSEDLIYMEPPPWTAALLEKLKARQEALDIARPENSSVQRVAGEEFPEPFRRPERK